MFMLMLLSMCKTSQFKNMIFQSCASAALQRAKQLSYCRLKIEEVGLNVSASIPWPAPRHRLYHVTGTAAQTVPCDRHRSALEPDPESNTQWFRLVSLNTVYLHCENKVNIHTASEQYSHFPKWKHSFSFILHAIMFIFCFLMFT